MRIEHVNMVVEDQILLNGWIEFEQGLITGLGSCEGICSDLPWLLPGFIDEHIHGCSGYDVMDADLAGLEKMAMELTKEGVTSFLATTMTESTDRIQKALDSVQHYMIQQKNGAQLLGVHLEGPFISPKVLGAHRLDHIMKPSKENFKSLSGPFENIIRLVTIAPEEDDQLALTSYLKQSGIVASLGHSEADADTVDRAILHGATGITHCYNAMRPFNHREDGLLTKALTDDRLCCEYICDGVHSTDLAAKLLYKAKGPDKILLVTDAIRAKGCPDGIYELGGQSVHKKGSTIRTAAGNLAGSALHMNEAAANFKSFVSCSMVEASLATSANPARHLGIYDQKGSLTVGKDADLVMLSENFKVMKTFCKGQLAYTAD